MKKNILLAALLSLLVVILEVEVGVRTYLPFSMFWSQPLSTEPVTTNSKPALAVTVSAYSPTEEECDEDPYITAYQKPVKEGTIAISRDLEEELGWGIGDKVYLTGLGVFEVWDRMHPKWKKKVDIFFHDTEKAVSFGVKQAKVLKVEKREKKGV